jgi:hypothetical protein
LIKGGDFVECGVWYGVLSKTICEYLSIENFGDRKFYLVDTFGETQESHTVEKYKKDIYDDVKDRFSMYPQIQIIRGVVPDCLTKITSSSTNKRKHKYKQSLELQPITIR